MRSNAPALLPILRSKHLAEILTVILPHPDSEYTLSELARTPITAGKAARIPVGLPGERRLVEAARRPRPGLYCVSRGPSSCSPMTWVRRSRSASGLNGSAV